MDSPIIGYVITAALSVVIFYGLQRLRAPQNRIPRSVEELTAEILANVDAGQVTDDLLASEQGFFSDIRKRNNFRAQVIIAAKVEFGLMSRTKANRLVVRKFMRDLMRERGMRPSHINEHLEVCVACYFIPSHNEIVAVQVGATSYAHNRQEEVSMGWTPYYGLVKSILGFRED